MTPRRRARLWSVPRIGDPRHPGIRVRVTELDPGGPLYLVRMVQGKQRMASLSCTRQELGVTPRAQEEAARAKALAVIDHLARGGDFVAAPRADTDPEDILTLRGLADLYGAHGFHLTQDRYRKEQKSKLDRIAAFLGPDRPVRSLCRTDVEAFTASRRNDGVGQGTIASDLAGLKIALNWGLDHKRSDGRPLLDTNPLARVRIEHEKVPRRPVAGLERYTALKAVADKFPPAFGLALDLVWLTGRRIGAVLGLRWEGVSFGMSPPSAPHGTIRWYAGRATTNKAHDQVVPINAKVRAALLQERAARPATPAARLFPAPKDRSQVLPYHHIRQWMEQAEKAAGLPHLEGGLWHPFRRGWATARKEYPLKDVAEVGGWRDTTTLQRSYLHSDADTILAVVNG